MEGGSPKMIRQPLRIDNRRGIKQEFYFDANVGYKGMATPSISTWANSGRGIEGETVNATNSAAKQIIHKNWKPLQS